MLAVRPCPAKAVYRNACFLPSTPARTNESLEPPRSATKPQITELRPESKTLRVSGRHRLGIDSFDQFSDGGLGLTVRNDMAVEAVFAVLVERSLFSVH